MDGIFNANDEFDFEQLKLSKPTAILGGNFFIKFSVNNKQLYIQPPKCKTKQGIITAGKKIYSDLLFDSVNDDFIRWMENLVNHCQHYLFRNRESWFDDNMEMHDIENFFTSPLKSFKSGKYYSVRINILSNLGNISTTIYDEEENEVNINAIDDTSNIITILEVSGIKCTATYFQVEFILKQMLVLKPIKLFEKCIIKTQPQPPNNLITTPNNLITTPNNLITTPNNLITTPDDIITSSPQEIEQIVTDEIDHTIPLLHVDTKPDDVQVSTYDKIVHIDNIPNSPVHNEIITGVDGHPTIDTNGLEEITFNLDELPENDNITIKNRNDVYYEMYREARRKSKKARDLALSTYLEAKLIKNTYMLDDIDDDEDDDDDDEHIDELLDKLDESE